MSTSPSPMFEETNQNPSVANQIIGVLLGVIATMGAVIAKLKSSIKNRMPSDDYLDAKIERILRQKLIDERRADEISEMRQQMKSIETTFAAIVRRHRQDQR